MRFWILGTLALALLAACPAVAQADGVAGTYKIQGTKGDITLVLKQTEDGIEGTLAGGDLNATLKGYLSPDGSYLGVASGLDGAVMSYFSVSTGDGQLYLDIMGANKDGDPDVANKRRIAFPMAASPAVKPAPSLDRAKQLANAGAGKPATPPKTAASESTSKAPNRGEPTGAPGAGKAWKSYTHPTGLGMKYPADWTMQITGGVTLLTPPDQVKDATGPQEIYVVTGEGAEGVTDINDPRVLPYLEQQMAQLAPFLQRIGEPQQMRVATAPGIAVTWEGTNPYGKQIRAKVHATILKGYAVSLIALGQTDKIATREGVLQAIFASFGAGAGKRDPALVGQWKFWSYKSTADGKYGTETTRFMVLRPDGTCSWSSKGESSGVFSGRNQLGEQTWNQTIGGVNQDADQGTWSAGDGQLFILWGDGSTGTWDYTVSGTPGTRKLLLKGNKPQPDEWMEVR
jgi:hypothetical protein